MKCENPKVCSKMILFGFLAACASQPPPVVNPSALIHCHAAELEDNLQLAIGCGDLAAMASDIPTNGVQVSEATLRDAFVRGATRGANSRRDARATRVALGGVWHDGVLLVETETAALVGFDSSRGTGRFVACMWPLNSNGEEQCRGIINALGAEASFVALQSRFPEDPEVAAQRAQDNLAACAPTDRLHAQDFGTFERSAQLACGERTILIAEEMGRLNDESRSIAFDRFQQGFQAVNSDNGSYALNGVEHPAVFGERSEPNGQRTEGIAVLFPISADRHKLVVCLTPGDIDACDALIAEAATLQGLGVFGGASGQNSTPAATPAPAAPSPAAPSPAAPSPRAAPDAAPAPRPSSQTTATSIANTI